MSLGINTQAEAEKTTPTPPPASAPTTPVNSKTKENNKDASTPLETTNREATPANKATDKQAVPALAIISLEEYEKIATDLLTSFKNFNEILSKITDTASANKYAPELKKLAATGQACMVKLKKTPKPSPEIAALIKSKFETETNEVMMNYMGNMMRIQKDNIQSEALEEAFAILLIPQEA